VEGDEARSVCEGEAEEIGGQSGSFWLRRLPDAHKAENVSFGDHEAALRHALAVLGTSGYTKFDAVGHRFVHGGPHLRDHARLDAAVLDALECAVEYAPLHMPADLSVLKAVEKRLPGVPQVVCFDTAFHRHMPDVSRTYALPERVQKLGVERYGFHGLSLESIMRQLGRQPGTVPKRLVAAHLGNGASVTAIRDGISIDTSMGMTPTGGVMMGTRCGDLDPGVMIYLSRHGYGKADDMERLCDHESGLFGISGGTSDVRELVRRRKTDAQADLALRMFCYQVQKTIAAMAAALGGIDALVFTGGIGEHAAEVRDEIRRGLSFLREIDVKVLPSLEDEQICDDRCGAKLIWVAAIVQASRSD